MNWRVGAKYQQSQKGCCQDKAGPNKMNVDTESQRSFENTQLLSNISLKDNSMSHAPPNSGYLSSW